MQGKASVLVAEDSNCIGILALSDILRPEAEAMVKKLHSMNTDIVLLTGDNAKTADYFAKQVGITNVCAELLPEEKVEKLMMPAFTMDLSIDNLPEILQEMGMVSAFKGDADLDKIGPDRYVSDVAHRAKIEVFEEGTRAAAITEIVTNDSAAIEIEKTIKFIADSPFIYVIRDTESGIILFMGQVTSLK